MGTPKIEERVLTPDEVREQRAGSRHVAPGVWIDKAGDPHINVPELLEFFEIEDTPENRKRATDAIVASMDTMPETRVFVQHAEDGEGGADGRDHHRDDSAVQDRDVARDAGVDCSARSAAEPVSAAPTGDRRGTAVPGADGTGAGLTFATKLPAAVIGPDVVNPFATRPCPVCHKELGMAFYIGAGMPKDKDFNIKPGDLTICAYCSTVLEVTGEGFVVASDAMKEHIDPVAKRALEVWVTRRTKETAKH